MIYTKLSPVHQKCDDAETILEIENIIDYVKLNIADRKFSSFTEAMMEIMFFTDTLYVAPTLNNDDEFGIGIYYWDGEENHYTGMYFYEVKDKFNEDSVLWICFEELEYS